MKYALVIPDGAADHPLPDLGGRTPFEAADIPHLDRMAREGRLGTVVTTPAPMPCGSDVCSMCLLGYDPLRFHTGRGPLEAAAMGIDLSQNDWVFRANLVTVHEGRMVDHSAGHIRGEEGRRLLGDLAAAVDTPDLDFHPGLGYRNLLVDRGGRDYGELATTAPHDIPGKSVRKYRPVGGEFASLLQALIDSSEKLFADHEINLTRREMGELPATHLWPWGQGRRPSMPSFESRFGLRGAMITAVDLLAGISAFIGWDRLEVPGQTSYHDNDYVAAGDHAVAALADYDIVCVHIESPDEAAHAADATTKVAAIEAIDRHVVGPLHAAMEQRGDDWRILCLPDHYTRVDTRKHDPTPVPFVICGKQIQSVVERPFSEADANASDLQISHGHELMEFFLYGGL